MDPRDIVMAISMSVFSVNAVCTYLSIKSLPRHTVICIYNMWAWFIRFVLIMFILLSSMLAVMGCMANAGYGYWMWLRKSVIYLSIIAASSILYFSLVLKPNVEVIRWNSQKGRR